MAKIRLGSTVSILLLGLALLGGRTLAAASPEDETLELIQALRQSRGFETITLLKELAERYDPRCIQPIIETVDRGMLEEGYALARSELTKYGRRAEDAILEYLREDHSTDAKLQFIDMLASMQSGRAASVLIDLIAGNEDPRLRSAVDLALLSIGDVAAPDLARLVVDPVLGPHAERYLQNTVTVEALRLEVEKRSGPISEEEWEQLSSQPAELTRRLLLVIRGREEVQEDPVPTETEPEENPLKLVLVNLLMGLGVLGALALLFFLSRLSRRLPGYGGRRRDGDFQRVEELIAREMWDDALAFLGRTDAGIADGSTLGTKKKMLKAQILLGRGQQALAEGRFDQAEDDFEHHCHLTGEAPEMYREQVQQRRLTHDAELAQGHYVSGALEQALSAIEDILSLEYTYGPAHLLKGMIALEEGRPEEAAEEFRLAARYLDHPDASLDTLQALALERAGDPEAAVSLLTGSPVLASAPLAALVLLRTAAATREQLPQAIQVAEKLLEERDQELQPYPEGCFMAELQKRFAYKDRISAGDVQNFEAACHHYLGRLLQAQGDRTGRAQRELAQAREMGFPVEG